MPEPEISTNHDSQPTYARGKKFPAWLLIALPFVVLIKFVLPYAKGICWKSMALTIVLFEIALFFVEHNSIMRGHWVYNTNRILGITIWNIPIEEPLIYYLFPPLMVVVIYHCVSNLMRKKNRGGHCE